MRRYPKGECHLRFEDFLAFSEGQIVALMPPDDVFESPETTESFQSRLHWLAEELKGRVYLAAACRFHGDDAKRLYRLSRLARAAGVPLIATNDVLYHDPSPPQRFRMFSPASATHCTIDEAGFRLAAQCRAPSEKPG